MMDMMEPSVTQGGVGAWVENWNVVWKGKEGGGTLRRSGRFVAGCHKVCRFDSKLQFECSVGFWGVVLKVGYGKQRWGWEGLIGIIHTHGNVTATKKTWR